MDGEQLAGRRILVVAETFPNRIQPWMLNTTIQAMRHGLDVFVAASGRLGRTYQAAVDEYRLRQHTIYVDPMSYRGLFSPFRYLLSPSRELRNAARAGLVQAIMPLNVSDPQSTGKAVALAVPMGLRGLSLVHAHSMTMGYEFLRVSSARGIPLVQTFHGRPPSGVQELAPRKMERLFHEAACFLVNTEFARKHLESRGCSPAKIRILPQGTDLAEFPFAPSPNPPVDEPLRLVTVGRLHEDKGHVYALRALSRLSDEELRFQYRIVGVGPNRRRLEEEALNLGIADRVTFTGEADDEELRREYQSAHIFLFPSVRDMRGKHEETQGVAIQEAQASGCIVIATRTGGIPESVDNQCVQLVPDRDADALAAAVRRVAEQPERWRDWQEAGRRWVEQRYAIEVIGRRLAEIYDHVLRTYEMTN